MTFGYYSLTTVLAACSGLFWTSIIIIPNVKEMTVETIGGVVANAPALSSKTIMTYTMSENVQGVFFGMVPPLPLCDPSSCTRQARYLTLDA
jgi:uncharacterized BrkB/YihY/UPF0761 family membrane protein